MKIQLTEAKIDEMFSTSFNRDLMKRLGVHFPLRQGWKKTLIGRIVDEDILPVKTKVDETVIDKFFE